MRGFGDRLKRRAEHLGLNGSDVARRLGMDSSRYNKYENDKSEPDLESLIRIAEALEATAGQLLGMEPLPGSATTIRTVLSVPDDGDCCR